MLLDFSPSTFSTEAEFKVLIRSSLLKSIYSRVLFSSGMKILTRKATGMSCIFFCEVPDIAVVWLQNQHNGKCSIWKWHEPNGLRRKKRWWATAKNEWTVRFTPNMYWHCKSLGIEPNGLKRKKKMWWATAKNKRTGSLYNVDDVFHT